MRTNFLRNAAGLAILIAGGFSTAVVGQQPAAPAEATETANLKKAAAGYLQALRRGDRTALAASWTADGDYIDANGQRFKGRDLIHNESLAKVAEAELPVVETSDVTIRFLRPDVAIEDGVTKVGGSDQQDFAGARYSAVWVKERGKWLLDSVRESATPEAPSQNPLDALKWMLGDWLGESKGMTIAATVKPVEDGRFIERKFTVRRGDQVVLHGTQLIGWDPAEHTVKSWAFDSQGGHGEGIWSLEGDLWTVDTTGVLADGREVVSTSTFKHNPDGTIRWTATSPDVPDAEHREAEVIFKRQIK